ncbi:hypothetical protein [Sinorhizobium meliloti]|uniref:hypothetical protein n=1 Tax=Rhizobium meliloti TaxID=382 RepID=UPI000FDC6DE8|nr:hypothetical protein [Sinorhizobium meliloti]RVG70745.1 hypothetical protein CN223_30675 [Sinorhizobium meliloti]
MNTNTKKKSKNYIAYLNTIASVSYDFSVSFGAGYLGATIPSITPSRSSATASQFMVSAMSIPRLSSVDGGGAVRCFRTSALRALA